MIWPEVDPNSFSVSSDGLGVCCFLIFTCAEGYGSMEIYVSLVRNTQRVLDQDTLGSAACRAHAWQIILIQGP
jgi:hypothetical protein